jgi:hypothetical protein
MSDKDIKEITRSHLHTRNIRCEGFERSDGLWDIEARLVDTKTQSFINHERGEIEPGEPIHEMIVVVTLDLDLEIRDVDVRMPWTPFAVCPKARKKMKDLVGLRIAPGWLREVKTRIPRDQSCTHLIELLGPISTTAYQTMHLALEQRENTRENRNEPPILDQCHALTRSSEAVKVMWPEFYRHKSPEN